jgi:hypothetical protein
VRKVQKTRPDLLISLAGARPEILDDCPTERIRFQSLGWALLITSGMATVSMWFALDNVLGLNVVAAFFGAVLWGLIILGIDRWLITSMPLGSTRRFWIALPRLVLAILLGTLISTPIVLRIFQSEINAQITVIKAQQANNYLKDQQKGQVDAQVAYWTKDVNNLNSVIVSKGQVTINPANDPEVKGLTAQKARAVSLQQMYYNEWQCQLYGGTGCTAPKGNGVLAQASHENYLNATSQVNQLTAQIGQRDAALQAETAQSQAARLQEAQGQLPAAKSQLAQATAEKNTLQAQFDASNEKANGLLIRLQALSQLTDKGATLSAARFLLFLLFLVIECLPVTVKLFQQPGNYERILAEAQEDELWRARQRYTRRPARGAAGASAPTLVNFSPPGGGNGRSRGEAREREQARMDEERQRDQARDAAIRDMWQRDAPAWAGGTSAGERPAARPAPAVSEDSREVAGLDDAALRAMADLPDARPDDRGYADPRRNGSRRELSYGDDEL